LPLGRPWAENFREADWCVLMGRIADQPGTADAQRPGFWPGTGRSARDV